MAIFGSKIYPKDRGGHWINDVPKDDDDIGQGRSGSCSRKRMMVLTWTGKRWADRVQLQLSRFAPIVHQLQDGVPPPPVCCRSTIIQSELLVPENNYSFTQSRESLSLILLHAGWQGRGREILRITKYFHSLGGLLFLAAGQ